MQNKQSNGKAYLALTATCILWGTTWVASKTAVAQVPALQLAYIRQFLAGSCFLIYFLFFQKHPFPSIKELKSILVMSVLTMVLANGLSTWGLRYIPTGLASLIGSLYPLIVVLIEWFFYKKKDVSKLTFIGLFIGIGGVAFVFYQNMFSHMDSWFLFGLLLSLIAIFAWSLGTIFLSRHHLTVNPYFGMGLQMIMGSFMLFIIANITRSTIPISSITFHSWSAIAYLILAGSLLSFIAFIYSLKKLPAAVASLYAYVNPIVAMITASILLNEKLTATIMIGTIITLIGVFMVNYSVKRDKEDLITEAEI